MAVASASVRSLAATLALGATLLLAPGAGTPLHAQPANRAAPPAPPGVKAAPAVSAAIPSHVQALLQDIRKADADQLAVSEEDGRFLRLMVTTGRVTNALEIGGAHGYSAIWIGLGLRHTGGRLTTIESDAGRARALAENIRKAGLSDIVTVKSGDAFAVIPTLTGTFDFVFLDAWKRDYRKFFDLMLPRLTPRGLFLAHNVVNKRSEMPDFLDAIRNNPNVITSVVAPSGEGMSVTVKVR